MRLKIRKVVIFGSLALLSRKMKIRLCVRGSLRVDEGVYLYLNVSSTEKKTKKLIITPPPPLLKVDLRQWFTVVCVCVFFFYPADNIGS